MTSELPSRLRTPEFTAKIVLCGLWCRARDLNITLERLIEANEDLGLNVPRKDLIAIWKNFGEWTSEQLSRGPSSTKH